jgi:Na+(H+)/acetate symporter ActP
MGDLAWTCAYEKGGYFDIFMFCYLIALVLVAYWDDRFLRNFAKFRFFPFSHKRFGMAAVVNIVSVLIFIALIVWQKRCA